MNCVISDVNNATIDELNTALGLILYKGHKKDKTVITPIVFALSLQRL